MLFLIPLTPRQDNSTNVSRAERFFGAIVLRQASGGPGFEAFVVDPAAALRDLRDIDRELPLDGRVLASPFPMAMASGLECERQAASAAISVFIDRSAAACRLLPLPPVAHVAAAPSGALRIFHTFVAAAAGDTRAQTGRWVHVDKLAAEAAAVVPGWEASIQAAAAVLREAMVVGMLSTLSAAAKPAPTPIQLPAAPQTRPRKPGEKAAVTIVCGLGGSGKTTLLQHLVRGDRGGRTAVLVDDLESHRIDPAVVARSTPAGPDGRILELRNGAICSTMNEEALQTLSDMSRAGRFDFVVVEGAAAADPLELAASLNLGEDGANDTARLDTCVTVIDAGALLSDLATTDTVRSRLGERAGGVDDDDDDEDRNVVDVLVDQIEAADVIVLNKTDLVPAKDCDQLVALLRRLNPDARIVPAARCQVDPGEVLGTGRYSPGRQQQGSWWSRALEEEEAATATEDHGVSTMVYRARRPFHPARLHALVSAGFKLQEPDWTQALADYRGSSAPGPASQPPVSLSLGGMEAALQETAKAVGRLGQEPNPAVSGWRDRLLRSESCP